ncbi:DUF4468 domain-containing protein [Pedobacter sp. CFBP9032]|uniref:DUF4468 domain-containing protein n=1 Tax=Pedobacter sp. CFBP9032 TaxID=3096539 RepID=UPI002A6A53EB|nr:DUF4468 domain-containing protein [Pedobacter sp. CFBP9032]MDY0903324.1 DUF4468 domain-containing protein [Pedobacter sp. CFBP9032]
MANYIVIDCPGESKANLYKNTLKYLNSQFTSPKDAFSLVDNESITINGTDSRIPVKGYTGSFILDYSLTIEVKDDKLRILAPSINQIYGYPVRDIITIGVTGDKYNKTIYNSKGEVKLEKTKKVIELIFKSWIIKTKIAIEKAKSDKW